MVDDDKPRLDAVYLAHFGVKGMHWGVRRDSTRGSHVKRVAKKAAIVATGIAGMVAVHYLTGRHGSTKMSEIALKSYVDNKERKATYAHSPLADLAKRFRDVHAATLPSTEKATRGMSLAEIRKHMDDPNYVWEI